MGILPKEFSQTSPDPTLTKAAAAGAYGSGGLAKLAHVNAVIGTLTLAAYPDNAGAVVDLATGDLYHTDGTGAAPLTVAGMVMVVQ